MRRVRSVFAAAALGSVVGLASSHAGAAVCPAPEGAPAVTGIDPEVRLEYLTRAFDREVRDIDTWSWTWGGIYTAAAVAQGTALVLIPNHATKIDLAVGTIAAGFGALSLTLLPLKLTLPMRSASAAAKRQQPGEDPCLALAVAERTLLQVAKDQALATGVLGHVGNVAVNLAIALVLGLGYGHWVSAAVSGGIGVAVGETNAFTQPHHLAEVLEHYRSGNLDPTPVKVSSWSVVPVVSPSMSGVMAGFAW
ncbi:MAG TPA: hypothetical protein VH044_06270 [Polyangiaceae bacterium]|jgi:hypothetical protein|nr:hypothetical protein [Polyangiaceae bacterium]